MKILKRNSILLSNFFIGLSRKIPNTLLGISEQLPTAMGLMFNYLTASLIQKTLGITVLSVGLAFAKRNKWTPGKSSCPIEL